MKPFLILICCFATFPARALEHLNPPAYLKGNPALYVDFNFFPGKNGHTRVEADLGGKFSDIRLPPGAGRPPRLRMSCQFEPRYRVAQEPLARGGVVDLARVLAEKNLSFKPGLFGKGASLTFHASIFVELAPAEYLVTIAASDEGLGLQTEKTLRLTVPSPKDADWSLGDLRFCFQPPVGEASPAEANPFRQAGKKAGFPLLVTYEVALPPADWTGNTLLHRFVITRPFKKKQRLVWSADETRPLSRNGSQETFEFPSKNLAKLPKGRYLLLIQVKTGDENSSRRHAFKSFEVVN